MSRTSRQPPGPVRPSLAPPLEPGDRLTREEFERRYDATPGLKKAELIEGIVYMPPPVSHTAHSAPRADVLAWLGFYRAATPHVLGGDNGSLRLDLDNMPQPDAYLLISPDHGGQSRIDTDGYVAGAPELVVEVASSSVSYDLHVKLHVYRRNGVCEYVVWRTQDRSIDYFVLRKGHYDRITPDAQGIIRSETFPGLWLAPSSLIGGDLVAVADLVRQGTNSPEHRTFVERVQSSGGRP